MGVDYYKILQVDRNAKDDDLKTAYLKLGLEEDDESKFKILSEAYDVLSDPQKRAVYDQFGEEGLKGQVPPRGSGDPQKRAVYDQFGEEGLKGQVPPRGSGSGGSYRRSVNDIFQECFGSSNLSSVDNRRSVVDPFDIFQEYFGSSNPFFRNNNAKGNFVSMPQQIKGAAIERTLLCSLEDLYNGTTKKFKISRNVTDATGRSTPMSEILTIKIMPGWKKRTKITFFNKGNEQHGVIPSDLVFIIDEKPHSVFKRDGNDLIATQKISFAEALTGYTAQFTTLDGRSLKIPFSSGISPTFEKVIEGEGMPFTKEPTRKGNLRINFHMIK